jgi:hypothetical protein
MVKENEMKSKITKAQLVAFISKREAQALELSKIFEETGHKDMAANYFGEFLFCQRAMMLIQGELDIKEFI